MVSSFAVRFIRDALEHSASGATRAARSASHFMEQHGQKLDAFLSRHGDELSQIDSPEQLRAFVSSRQGIDAEFAEALSRNADHLAPVIRRQGDTLDVMSGFNAAKRSDADLTMKDYLQRELDAGNLNDMDPRAFDHMVENSERYENLAQEMATSGTARTRTVRESLDSANGAAGRVWDGTKKTFSTVRSGFFRENKMGGHDFSLLRTAGTVTGLTFLNGLTGGAVGETGKFLMTSDYSPVVWIGHVVQNGGAEFVETASGGRIGGPEDLEAPDWVHSVEGYEPNRDGSLLLADDNSLLSVDEYAETYNQFKAQDADQVSSLMTPETYAAMRPQFQQEMENHRDNRPARERVADDIGEGVDNAVNGATAAASGAAATAGAAADDALDAAGGGLDRMKNMLSGIFGEASGAGLMAAAGAALGFATGGGLKGALGYGILGGFIGMMFPNLGQRVSSMFNDNANPEAEQAPAAAADPAAVGTSASGSAMSQQYASAQAGVAATGQDNDAVTPAEQNLRNNGQAIGAGTSPAPQEQQIEIVQRQPALAAPAPV